MQRHLNGLEQREVFLHHDILHELHKHFRVGVALELHTLSLQLRLDVGIILDDAVVDDGQIAGAGIVGMGVACRRFAMRGPARVGDADAAGDVLVAAIFRQVVHLALGLVHIEFAAVANHGHTGTVIAAIFKSFQSFNQNGIGTLGADISYDSAHVLIYLSIYNLTTLCRFRCHFTQTALQK